MSFRIAGMVGGVIMIVSGGLSFYGNFLALSLIQEVLSVYTFFFGFIVVMLEAQGFIYLTAVKSVIKTQAKFLTLLNGRGIFYCFLGTILFAQPGFGNDVLGIYMIVVGIFMFIVGVHSKFKLDGLRSHLKDEAVVAAAFKAADKSGDGAISPGSGPIVDDRSG
jgi:hypothetical protein